MANERAEASVGRAAWLGGIALGILIAASGFFLVSRLEVGRIAMVALEMGVMALALFVTTRVWAKSAERHALDTAEGGRDRGNEETR